MRVALAFALVAAAAAQAPVITLDLSTLSDFERLSNRKSSTLGLKVQNKNAGQYQDYVARCPAGPKTSWKNCPKPKADAYDHNDQKVAVTSTIWQVDEESRNHNRIVKSVDFKKRGAYLFKFNAKDAAGNRAEEVVFALLVDDLVKPKLNCHFPKHTELNHKFNLPRCTATDDIEKNVKITYTVADSSVRNAHHGVAAAYINGWRKGTFKLTVTANDHAGKYGKGNKDNTVSETYYIKTSDTTAPVIKLHGKDPVTTECAKPYSDAGAWAKDLVDKKVRVSSNARSLSTSTIGKRFVTYAAKDFSGNRAATVKRTVKVVDTTSPYTANFNDGTDRQTVVIGAKVVHPKLVCKDTCSKRFSYSSEWVKKFNGKAGTYERKFTCTDQSGNSRSRSRYYIFQDKTKPVINIVGYEKMQVEANRWSKYNDKGATCYDAHDGAIKVSSYGTAHPNRIGTYKITYVCRDAAGNKETAVRTVTVKDTTCPKVIVRGDTKVKIEAQTPYKEYGAEINDSFSGKSNAKVYGKVNYKKPGTYKITYDGQDKAGNWVCAKAYRYVTVQDTLPPVITLHLNGKVVAASSSKTNPAATKAGNPFIRFPKFMAQAGSNGWFIAAAGAAVAGVALLATGTRRSEVPV